MEPALPGHRRSGLLGGRELREANDRGGHIFHFARSCVGVSAS